MEAITEPPAATLTTVVSSAELSPVEAAKLENLEIVIEDGLQSFLDVGRALLQIRDERLYRLTHSTFESYCEAKWGISPRHANRLATAATITDGLGPIGPIVPTAESQVRPLAKLPVEERGDAWQEAVEASNGKPTAAVVEKIVERRKAPQAKAKAVEEGLVDDDDDLLDDVAAMLNGSVAALNKSKAVEVCPNCGGTDWDTDEIGRYCTKCKEPDSPQKKSDQLDHDAMAESFRRKVVATFNQLKKECPVELRGIFASRFRRIAKIMRPVGGNV